MKKHMSILFRTPLLPLLLIPFILPGCALFTPQQRSEKWYSGKIDFTSSLWQPGTISVETVTESEAIEEAVTEISELICRKRNSLPENPKNQIYLHITVKESPFYLRGELYHTSTLLIKITGAPEEGEEPEGIIFITRESRKSISSIKELSLLLKKGFASIPK